MVSYLKKLMQVEISYSTGFAIIVLLFYGIEWGFSSFWPVELFTHFPWHHVVFFGVLAGFFCIFRAWRAAGLMGFFMILVVFTTVHPWDLVTPGTVKKQGNNQFKAVMFNTGSSQSAARELLHSQPVSDVDVVFLVEAYNDFQPMFENWEDTFPHQKSILRGDNFGMAVLSRVPIEVAHLEEFRTPMLEGTLRLKGWSPSFLLVHTFPPVAREALEERNKHLRKVRKLMKKDDQYDLVLGDFNTSPWSPYFEDMMSGTKMKRLGRGDPTYFTWPAGNKLFYTAIDHVLYRPHRLQPIDYRIGRDRGSDHFPVYFEFQQTEVQ